MTSKIPTIHLIGQAHLDPVWLWSWTEGRAEALATCYSAANCLERYPDFHFTRGEAQIYRWIEEEAPELWAEIRRFIAEGRWHVVNGMVIQPDMNLPQGESFVRQALLGKRYFQEKLGLDVRIAFCVDSFGHAGTLPQILRKCGFDSYIFMRPKPHEKELPAEVFWWQSPDGSRILAYRIPGPYQTTPRTDNENHIAQALAATPDALNDTMPFFGVGNHGGGPTREMIESLRALAGRREDVHLRFSHPQAYFDAIAAQADSLPTVRDELQYHSVGCYAVNSQLKRLHRQAEGALLAAERMACLSHVWTGQAMPLAELDRLWWDLLFNQFHDTLGGTSIRQGEDEAIMAFGRVILSARELTNNAGRAIAATLDTSGPGSSVVVFNPFPQPIKQYLEYEPWTEWQAWDAAGWGLVDETGQPVPHQTLEAEAAMHLTNSPVNRLVFPVELPPLGYRLYRFAPGLPRTEVLNQMSVTPDSLANDFWRLRLDPASGAIISCVDQATGVELVGPAGWNVAQVLRDSSDTWSHGQTHFNETIGQFGAAKTTICDEGPLQSSLLIERVYEGNTWLQQLVLRQGDPAILLRNWICWQGRWQLVKLAFQVPTDQPRSFHDVPFGWLERPGNGQEVPTQMWVDVQGPLQSDRMEVRKPETLPTLSAGLALLNDGKYSCDVEGNILRLSILRTPPYAYHDPHVFGSKRRYEWVDQGCQEFNLVLLPHRGDWRETGLIARARALNLPPVCITTHSHPGRRPTCDSLARLEAAELELTAFKPAEDGLGFVIRLADKHGRGGSGHFIWQEQTFEVSLLPFEVTTWRIFEENGRWHFMSCDMLERKQNA